jgi:hypothetical protein
MHCSFRNLRVSWLLELTLSFYIYFKKEMQVPTYTSLNSKNGLDVGSFVYLFQWNPKFKI